VDASNTGKAHIVTALDHLICILPFQAHCGISNFCFESDLLARAVIGDQAAVWSYTVWMCSNGTSGGDIEGVPVLAWAISEAG
jgi:hypothetical protein